MKICVKCHVQKSEADFYTDCRNGKLRGTCKSCMNEANKTCKQIHPEKHAARQREYWNSLSEEIRRQRNKENYNKVQSKLDSIKSEFLDLHPCINCGENRHPCLDFHHVNPCDKERGIATIRTSKIFIEESKKCVILCANCHRLLHAGIISVSV